MIETLAQSNEAIEREKWLKEYWRRLLKLQTDIACDPYLTIDDKVSLAPSDQVSNVIYILSHLKCELNDFAARMEVA